MISHRHLTLVHHVPYLHYNAEGVFVYLCVCVCVCVCMCL